MFFAKGENRQAVDGVMFDVAGKEGSVFLQRHGGHGRVSGGQGCPGATEFVAVQSGNPCRLFGNIPIGEGGEELVPDWPIRDGEPGEEL